MRHSSYLSKSNPYVLSIARIPGQLFYPISFTRIYLYFPPVLAFLAHVTALCI